MEYRTFGRTGLKVSAMGFGTWPMSGDRYGPIEDEQAIRAIQRAIQSGVNCVDTAPGYGTGHAEEVTGRALKGRRDDVILVTKCGIAWNPETKVADRDSGRANILREVDASLMRLDTDRIDVYLVHWPDIKVPFEETAAVMDEVVKSGKVRYVGVSNFTVEMMEAFQKVRPIDVIQVGHHVFDRRMEQEIFPFCAKNNIGVMAYGSLGHGLLTGTFTSDTAFDAADWRSRGVFFGQPILKGDNFKHNVALVDRIKREVADPRGVPMPQLALAWVLSNPVVSTALVGSRSPEELQQNLAGTEITLSDDERTKIDEIMREAKGMISAFTPLKQAMEEWEPVAAATPAT